MAQDITQEQIAQIQAVIDGNRKTALALLAHNCINVTSRRVFGEDRIWAFDAMDDFAAKMQAIEAAQGYLDRLKDDTPVSAGKELTTAQKQRLWDAFQARTLVDTGAVMKLPPAVTLGGIDWQPMETAPRGDDTLSVLAWFCGQVVEVSWDADDSRWFGHVGEEYTDSDLDAWAPKPAGPSFGRGVQQ